MTVTDCAGNCNCRLQPEPETLSLIRDTDPIEHVCRSRRRGYKKPARPVVMHAAVHARGAWCGRCGA